MAHAKPPLGYPSQSAACAALAREGLTSAEIGERLGIAATTAPASTAYVLGKDGINRRPSLGPKRRRRRNSPCKQRTVLVDHEVLDALAPAPTRRRVGINELVRRLLTTIADEPTLVDAVLDDAADLPAVPEPRPQPRSGQVHA